VGYLVAGGELRQRAEAGEGDGMPGRQERHWRNGCVLEEGEQHGNRGERMGPRGYMFLSVRAGRRRRFPRRLSAKVVVHQQFQKDQHTDGQQLRGGLLFHILLSDGAFQEGGKCVGVSRGLRESHRATEPERGRGSQVGHRV